MEILWKRNIYLVKAGSRTVVEVNLDFQLNDIVRSSFEPILGSLALRSYAFRLLNKSLKALKAALTSLGDACNASPL